MIKIYALGNTVDGMAYIGCTSANLLKRMREHRSLLNNHKHNEKGLQEGWDKYGKEAFNIIVLEELPDTASVIEKREAELKWFKIFEQQKRLYNTNLNSFMAVKKGFGNYTNKGRKQTPEEIEKRRLAQLGKPKNHGHKISATKKRLGQKPSKEIASMGGKAACALRNKT
jgi:group I intron endonuclease